MNNILEYSTPDFFSNTMIKIISSASDEVLGIPFCSTRSAHTPSGFHAGSFSDTDFIIQSFSNADTLFNKYGKRGALGLATRIGEASFRHFLQEKGETYQMVSLSYHLMNANRRFIFGLEKIAKFSSENLPWDIEVFNHIDSWFWQISHGSKQLTWNDVWSSFFEGLLKEYLLWVSGGRFFVLQPYLVSDQIPLVCQIQIFKSPLGN